jgi:hypothetical protein
MADTSSATALSRAEAAAPDSTASLGRGRQNVDRLGAPARPRQDHSTTHVTGVARAARPNRNGTPPSRNAFPVPPPNQRPGPRPPAGCAPGAGGTAQRPAGAFRRLRAGSGLPAGGTGGLRQRFPKVGSTWTAGLYAATVGTPGPQPGALWGTVAHNAVKLAHLAATKGTTPRAPRRRRRRCHLPA